MYKQIFFVHNMNLLKLSLNELRLIAKSRGIKGYKSMSDDTLFNALSASESSKKVKRIWMTQNQKQMKIMMLINH